MRRFRGRKMIEEVLGKLNAPRHPIQLDYPKLKTYKALTRSLNSLPTTISKLRHRFYFLFQEVLIIRIPALSQPPMNPETVMVPRSRSVESQGCRVWKAEMWWNLCFARQLCQKCTPRLNPHIWKLGIFILSVMTSGSHMTSMSLVKCAATTKSRRAQPHEPGLRNAQRNAWGMYQKRPSPPACDCEAPS